MVARVSAVFVEVSNRLGRARADESMPAGRGKRGGNMCLHLLTVVRHGVGWFVEGGNLHLPTIDLGGALILVHKWHLP